MKTQLYSTDSGRPPKQILLVEDSEDDAFFFERTLEMTRVACQLAHVTNGSEAIEYLRAAHSSGGVESPVPDLIFLDLKLPVLNGFEVLKWIAEQAFHPALNVAILSGSEQDADIQRARELGATEYLVKPVSRRDLVTRLLALPDLHLVEGGKS